jgi:hypothetical protein
MVGETRGSSFNVILIPMLLSMQDFLFIALQLSVSILFNVISRIRPYDARMMRVSCNVSHKA